MESLFNRIHRSSHHEEGDAPASLPERGVSSSTMKASTAKIHPMDEQQYEIVNERLSYSNEESHQDVKTADAVSSVEIPAFISPPVNSIGFHNEDESISTRASCTSFNAAQVPDDVLDSVPSSSGEDEPHFLVETIHGDNCDDEVADDNGSVELFALWQSTIQSETTSGSFQFKQHHQRGTVFEPTLDVSEPSTTAPEVKNNSYTTHASHKECQTCNKVDVHSPNNGPRSVFYNFIIKMLNIVAMLVYACLVMAFVCFVICTITYCVHGKFSLLWKNPTLGKLSEPQAKPEISMKKQRYVKSTPLIHAQDLKLDITIENETLVIASFITEGGNENSVLMQDGSNVEESMFNLSNSSTVFEDGTESLLNVGTTLPSKAPVVQSLTNASIFFSTSMGLAAVDLVSYAVLASLSIGRYVLAVCITLLFFTMFPCLKQCNGKASRHQPSSPAYMQCQSADVDDLCHFLRLCENGLSRTGRVPRASPSKSSLFGYNAAMYQTLTKEELHNIGNYLRVPLLHSADNKATLIQKIVPAYEAKLQGMLVQELKQVLITKRIFAAAYEKKTDMVRLAVEAGF